MPERYRKKFEKIRLADEEILEIKSPAELEEIKRTILRSQKAVERYEVLQRGEEKHVGDLAIPEKNNPEREQFIKEVLAEYARVSNADWQDKDKFYEETGVIKNVSLGRDKETREGVGMGIFAGTDFRPKFEVVIENSREIHGNLLVIDKEGFSLCLPIFDVSAELPSVYTAFTIEHEGRGAGSKIKKPAIFKKIGEKKWQLVEKGELVFLELDQK